MKRAAGIAAIALVGAAGATWAGVAIARLNERGPDTIYNEQTVEVMRRVLGPDATGVDVGAYEGTLTAALVEIAPRGVHYAVEPQPEYALELARRFPQVRVLAVAFGDANGTMQFLQARADPARSGFRPQDYPTRNQRIDTIHVPVRRLDDAIDPALRVAFIKMDVEGAEYSVLKGARKTILRDRPVIVLEYGAVAVKEYGITPELMWALLHDEFGLEVSLMSAWLNGVVPYSRQGFINAAQRASDWMFIAYPQAPPGSARMR